MLTLAVFPNREVVCWAPVDEPNPPKPGCVVVAVPNRGLFWLNGVVAAELVFPNAAERIKKKKIPSTMTDRECNSEDLTLKKKKKEIVFYKIASPQFDWSA